MAGDVHTLSTEEALERIPNKGQHGLRFSPERYLPPHICVDFDEELKHSTKLRYMGRRISGKGLCFRCGAHTNHHSKALCSCQWCGGAADNGHPDRECPWIYTTVGTWRDKISAVDESAGRASSNWIPVNVQVKPTKEEQEVLAQRFETFRGFPYAREGHSVKIPEGVQMKKPARMPRPITGAPLKLGRGQKAQSDEQDSEELTEHELKQSRDEIAELMEENSSLRIQRDALLTRVKELEREVNARHSSGRPQFGYSSETYREAGHSSGQLYHGGLAPGQYAPGPQGHNQWPQGLNQWPLGLNQYVPGAQGHSQYALGPQGHVQYSTPGPHSQCNQTSYSHTHQFGTHNQFGLPGQYGLPVPASSNSYAGQQMPRGFNVVNDSQNETLTANAPQVGCGTKLPRHDIKSEDVRISEQITQSSRQDPRLLASSELRNSAGYTLNNGDDSDNRENSTRFGNTEFIGCPTGHSTLKRTLHESEDSQLDLPYDEDVLPKRRAMETRAGERRFAAPRDSRHLLPNSVEDPRPKARVKEEKFDD